MMREILNEVIRKESMAPEAWRKVTIKVFFYKEMRRYLEITVQHAHCLR